MNLTDSNDDKVMMQKMYVEFVVAMQNVEPDDEPFAIMIEICSSHHELTHLCGAIFIKYLRRIFANFVVMLHLHLIKVTWSFTFH